MEIKDKFSLPIITIITIVILSFVLWFTLSLDIDKMISFLDLQKITKEIKEGDADAEGVTLEGIKNIEEANNQFAFKVYSEIVKEDQKNVFFSPYSVSVIFSMLYEGAEEETAEEIQNVFGFTSEDDVRRPAMAGIYNRLNFKDREYTLELANSLWVEEQYEVLPDFVNVIERFYVGEVRNIDFINNPEESRTEINEWVAVKTNEIIKELFLPDSITSATKLVVTNAIYFKGDWVIGFDSSNTEEQNFYITDEEWTEVPMMKGRDDFFYYEDENIQVLELEYKGGDLSMIVALPKDKDIKSLEERIDRVEFIKWMEEKEKQTVEVFFPKFEINTRYDIKNYLDSLGIKKAFTEEANFLEINKESNLFISDIVHNVFISVDEIGTELAAVTGVVSMESENVDSEKVSIFKADHPFMLFIQEKDSNNIIFMGRIINPLNN